MLQKGGGGKACTLEQDPCASDGCGGLACAANISPCAAQACAAAACMVEVIPCAGDAHVGGVYTYFLYARLYCREIGTWDNK